LNKTALGFNKLPINNASVEIDDGIFLVDDLILALGDLGLGENTKRKKKDTNSQREIFHLS